MIKKTLIMMSMLALFVGCGGDEEEATPTPSTATATESEETVSMALITDVGGVNDQSFNQGAWAGMEQAATDFGVTVSYLESPTVADVVPNLEAKVEEGNDLIWTVGFTQADALSEVATAYPDQKFAIVDVAYPEGQHPNVYCVNFKAQEASFLAGYVAAGTTETGQVGFIGGMPGEIIDQFHYGFLAGVEYYNSVNGTDVKSGVQYAESFDDVALGNSIATGMYSSGYDIIFSAAGAVGVGVIDAAKTTGNWAIGVDIDQSYLAPDNVLTSVLKNVDQVVYDTAEKLVNGEEIPYGTSVEFGLAEGAVGLAPSEHISDELWAEVDAITQQIIDGTIVVPKNLEEYEAFVATL